MSFFPFSSDQLPVSTKFDMRSDPGVVRNYGKLLLEMVSVVPDGIVCFFVSYSYMDGIISVWNDSGILKVKGIWVAVACEVFYTLFLYILSFLWCYRLPFKYISFSGLVFSFCVFFWILFNAIVCRTLCSISLSSLKHKMLWKLLWPLTTIVKLVIVGEVQFFSLLPGIAFLNIEMIFLSLCLEHEITLVILIKFELVVGSRLLLLSSWSEWDRIWSSYDFRYYSSSIVDCHAKS